MLTFPTWCRWSRVGEAWARGLVVLLGRDRAVALVTGGVVELGWEARPAPPRCRARETSPAALPGDLCAACELLHRVVHAGEVRRG